MCPTCGSGWKTEPNGDGTSTVIWRTCGQCEEAAAQQVHDADDPEEDCTDGNGP